MATPKYNAPKYDEKKYSKGINTSFYTNAINSYTNQAQKERNNQLAEAQKTQNANLKQAYITRLQNERNLNNNLVTAGIRGGATETSQLNLANQYGTARAAANTDYANTVNSINQAYDKNVADYKADMLSRAEEYRQNQMNARWQAAREDAANKWNAAREDKNNEIARQTEYWSNFYINKYSGLTKKEAQSRMKKLQKQYNKTKDTMKKIQLEQAIAAAGARLGVIATSK